MLSRVMRKWDEDGVPDPNAVAFGDFIIKVRAWLPAACCFWRMQQGCRDADNVQICDFLVPCCCSKTVWSSPFPKQPSAADGLCKHEHHGASIMLVKCVSSPSACGQFAESAVFYILVIRYCQGLDLTVASSTAHPTDAPRRPSSTHTAAAGDQGQPQHHRQILHLCGAKAGTAAFGATLLVRLAQVHSCDAQQPRQLCSFVS